MLAGTEYGAAMLDEVPTPIVGADGTVAVRLDVSTEAAYLVALVPVSDPYFRYSYARRARLTNLVEGSESYFVTTDTMRATSVTRIVAAGEAGSLPSLLVVQAGDDANVPLEMTMELLRAWQSRDGHIEYAYFPVAVHSFPLRKSEDNAHMVTVIRDFVLRHAQID
jgi:dipeptidyl aminopeptidase/acylaminoacyl peptidase